MTLQTEGLVWEETGMGENGGENRSGRVLDREGCDEGYCMPPAPIDCGLWYPCSMNPELPE